MKGLIIAGTKSGCGKTTISLGLMAALIQRGLKVAPFKVGPDFIDPGYHSHITGKTSRNLDGWMLSKVYNQECFRRSANTADIAVIEGVMGLYDGYDGKSEAGSTAQMAKWLGLPVILTVDAKSMARSAAAIVSGFEKFDKDLIFAGVIFNHLGSKRHLHYLKDALVDSVQMSYLGGLFHDNKIEIPERHLGLVTREDHVLTKKNIDMLVRFIEKNLALDKLIQNLPEVSLPKEPVPAFIKNSPKKVRIGVARDNAFCFYYRDNLDLLEQHGAELVFFSPIFEKNLPEKIDGLYFGGGYPELHAYQLAVNLKLKKEIKDLSVDGMPIYSECGGFMFLCDVLFDSDGDRHPMAGCFPFEIKMSRRLTALGYREVTLTRDTIIGTSGQSIRGHEFHYSELIRISPSVETAFKITDRIGMKKSSDGYMVHRTLGSYNHLHFGSEPSAAACFVKSCIAYRRERGHME